MSTREKILASATDIFSELGYQKTSMDMIAANAGISKGALYYFFKNKASLYLAVVEEGLNILDNQIRAIADSGLAKKDTIRNIIKVYFNTCLDYPQFAITILNADTRGLDDQLADKIRDLMKKQIQQFINILDEGERYHYIRSCNKEVAAGLFFGMLRALCTDRDLLNLPSNRDELLDDACSIIIDGINYRG
jgi:TetR/AcrR family transcriptional regulator